MEIPRHWREQGARLRLEGSRCVQCGALAVDAVVRCASCGGARLSPHRFSGRGELWSFTEVVEAPSGFEGQAPYLVGLVRLEEGPMLAAGLTDLDPEEATIGLPVEMVTRKLFDGGPDGLIVYGYKFRPRLS